MFGLGLKAPQVSVDEVKELIDKGEKIILLDVRTGQEVARGKIKGSINIPLDNLSEVEKIVKSKEDKICIYCLSGSRSNAAVDQLVKMGYQNVWNMTSGILAWRAKGYPLIQ